MLSENVNGGWASEGSHWYKPDGEPCYTVIAKNGKERPTTLRDARVLGLLPSVTTVIRLAAAPGLERWKREQVLLAALTVVRVEGEVEAELLKRIVREAEDGAKQMAAIGTRIHGAVERFHRTTLTPDDEYFDWVMVANREIAKHCNGNVFHTERSFGNSLGFGGKLDLHNDSWIIDVKTKDDITDVEPFDENVMQLAAYRIGTNAPGARCANLFLSRREPSAILVEIPEADLQRGWNMFRCLLEFYRAKTGHMP